MRRSIFLVLAVLICIFCTQCIKYVGPPGSEVQRLYMTGSWILVYSDSSSLDSANVLRYFRFAATECEKQELITFAKGITYHINLVCNQAVPGEFVGSLTYNDEDSTMGYGLKTDTLLSIAKLVMVTADTLKLIQRSSFAAPDIRYTGFQEKTYSH